MKATNLAIWSLVALFAAGFTACEKDDIEIAEPHMILTMNEGVGSIELDIDAKSEDRNDVWIDLNNNGIQENGEKVNLFHNVDTYSFSSKTVSIYGKVTELDCSFNQLIALDVSKNTALIRLKCYFNRLTALDVSKNTALIRLECYFNRLTALDVSKNTALISLDCYFNKLKALDISKNSALTWLNCSCNQLTKLNLSKNTELEILECFNNHLTELNVSKNTELEILKCFNNQLTGLNVSKNTVLQHLYCYNNSIYDSKMDALVNSLPDRTASTEGSFLVINTGYDEGNICTPAQVYIAKNKNWNVMDSEGNTYTGSK